MKTRCENPNYAEFHLYGGRGIRICEQWRYSYEQFLSDVGRKPSLKHSLDRIDVNGDYTPCNVRWASATEQGRNKRNNRRITYKGRTLCLVEWALVCGVRPSSLHERLGRYGDQAGLALYEPFSSRETPL
jgi:hypothetical protein